MRRSNLMLVLFAGSMAVAAMAASGQRRIAFVDVMAAR